MRSLNPSVTTEEMSQGRILYIQYTNPAGYHRFNIVRESWPIPAGRFCFLERVPTAREHCDSRHIPMLS